MSQPVGYIPITMDYVDSDIDPIYIVVSSLEGATVVTTVPESRINLDMFIANHVQSIGRLTKMKGIETVRYEISKTELFNVPRDMDKDYNEEEYKGFYTLEFFTENKHSTNNVLKLTELVKR